MNCDLRIKSSVEAHASLSFSISLCRALVCMSTHMWLVYAGWVCLLQPIEPFFAGLGVLISYVSAYNFSNNAVDK